VVEHLTDHVVLALVALVAGALTLFSGFGLGTLLMPAMALFYDLETAIAATAVVHLVNNVLKLWLVGRWAAWRVVLVFGAPAALFAFLGARVLAGLGSLGVIAEYELFGVSATVTPEKLVIGALIGVFALLEGKPGKGLGVSMKWLPVGGALSGFFGGLSGHQGALRTVFLRRAGLGKKELVGTFAACAVLVDASRLLGYGVGFFGEKLGELQADGRLTPVYVAMAAAFTGSFVGARLVKKVTLQAVQGVITGMLLVTAVLLITGLI